MQTIRNIFSLAVLGVWVYFGVRLAMNWEFSTFGDWAAYLGIMAILFLLAMAGISGAQRAGAKKP